jgi:hypothetical protein
MTKALAKSAEVFQEVNLSTLPNGEFDGIWGGYEVKATIHGEKYRFRVDNGIRTPRAECIVFIQDGNVGVITK